MKNHIYVPLGYLGKDMPGMLAMSFDSLELDAYDRQQVITFKHSCVKTNLGPIYVSNGVMTGRAV